MVTSTNAPQYLPVREATPMAYVDPKGFYKLTLQLGARVRWRGLTPGKWTFIRHEEVKPRNHAPGAPPPPPLSHYEHRAAVHDIECLDGRTVNGLISEHNNYLEWHSQTDGGRPTPEFIYEGGQQVHNPVHWHSDVSRQILITDIEPTDAPENPMDASRLKEIAATVDAVIRGLVSSGILGTPAAAAKAK